MPSSSLWQRFQRYFLRYDDLHFSVDTSRMNFADDFFAKMQPRIDKAFKAMRDYLHGFLRGTRSALYENGRESITISIPDVDAASVGALIALYERTVGFYGSLVNINAYHQPGVEAGKKAATKLLQLQNRVRGQLSESGKTAEELARAADADPEDVFHILSHLASNDPSVRMTKGEEPSDDKFFLAAAQPSPGG